MSDYITYELSPNLDYNKFRFPYTNRYKYNQVYSIENELFFETFDIPEVPISPADNYYPIKAGEEGRWDLISHKFYKTVGYWWLICLANQISNPFEIKPTGTVIRIPSLDYLIQKDKVS